MSNMNWWRDGGIRERDRRVCGRWLREESPPLRPRARWPLATEKTLEDVDDALSFIALLLKGAGTRGSHSFSPLDCVAFS